MLIVILAALGYGGYEVVRAQLDTDERRATVEQFVRAWEKGDYEAMYALLDAPSQRANPKISFLADYRRANRSATVEKVTIGRIGPLRGDGTVRVPVTVTTDDFGKLEGTLTFKASETEDGVHARRLGARAAAARPAQRARRSAAGAAAAPTRGNIYAAGGKLLNSDALGASIAGVAGKKPTGLERIYDDRLGGARSSTLRFGDRVIAKVEGRRGRSITTTIRLGLQRTAQNALGERLGGIAVIKPSDGSVLALAGPRRLRAPAARLELQDHHRRGRAAARRGQAVELLSRADRGDAERRDAAQRRRRVLRRLALELLRALLQLGLRAAGRQARRQAAGRRRRALRLQRDARGPRGQGRARSRRPRTCATRLAVGASAIGQDKDLATPLEMASVAATIANQGVRIKPWLAGKPQPAQARRVAPRSRARCAT